jgi:hypothetical protein
MEDAKPIRTLMGTNDHLDLDASGDLWGVSWSKCVLVYDWKFTLFDDWMWFLVYACVQDFKHHHKKVIWLPKDFEVFEAYIKCWLWYPRITIWVSWVLRFWIMRDARWIERAHQVHVYMEDCLCHGPQRSKTWIHF